MVKKKIVRTFNRKNILFILALLIITFTVYSQVIKNEFVNYDDETLIRDNRPVYYDKEPLRSCFEYYLFTPHYKPLVLLSWRAEYQIFGYNPAVFHLDNLLLHLLNTLLVFLLSLRLLRIFILQKSQDITIASFFVAMLFAIHPLHVESVAWAVERKDVLYTLFFLLSWLSYIMYIEKGKYNYLLLSALFYLLVIFSKSMGITLIAVLFLTDYVYGRGKIMALLKEKIPLLLCFIFGIYIYGLADYFLINASESGVNHVNIAQSLDIGPKSNAFLQFVLMVFLKLFFFFLHILFPFRISAMYEGPLIKNMLGGFLYLIPVLFTGIYYWGYQISKKYKEIFFGLVFFLITISPAFVVVKYGGVGVFISDRFTYVPMLGLLLPIVLAILRLSSAFKNLSILLLISLSIAYSYLSVQTVKVWKNSETLWSNVIEKTKCSAPAYLGRGIYYSYTAKDMDKALSDYNQAIACDGTYAKSFYSRGLLLMKKGKNNEAVSDYTKAIELNPNYAEAYVNRGVILVGQEKYNEALADYTKVIELNPEFSINYFNRGILLTTLKKFDEAINDFSKAIEYNKDYSKAYFNRGLAKYYSSNSNQMEACKDLRMALNLGFQPAEESIKQICNE